MSGVQRLLCASIAFALAAGVNTASVALQRRHRFLTRHFGPGALRVHLALIGPPWVIFVLSLRKLDIETRWRLPRQSRPHGAALLAAAGVLWALAARELGPRRMGNGYFFGVDDNVPVTKGVFRRLSNPVYDSYALALVGQAFFRCDARYLVLAAESILLLNGLEASVENEPFGGQRFPISP